METTLVEDCMLTYNRHTTCLSQKRPEVAVWVLLRLRFWAVPAVLPVRAVLPVPAVLPVLYLDQEAFIGIKYMDTCTYSIVKMNISGIVWQLLLNIFSIYSKCYIFTIYIICMDQRPMMLSELNRDVCARRLVLLPANVVSDWVSGSCSSVIGQGVNQSDGENL